MSGLRRAARRALEPAIYLYRLAVVPFGALLPAPAVYRFACWRGDLRYRRDVSTRQGIIRALERILGDALSPEERERAARDFFRLQYCSLMDWMRLRGDGRSLGRLVEVRGLEHVERALAEGRGALVCTGHFGNYQACFSLFGLRGLPATAIKRSTPGAAHPSPSDELGDRILHDRLTRHMRSPDLDPIQGQFATAVQAANVLRRNEILGVYIDPPALEADRARASELDFLGRRVRLLTGILSVAQRTKSPVFVALTFRSADWTRQILEVSPPIPTDGTVDEMFQRCLSVIEQAVRSHPGQWLYWSRPDDLADLGLLSPDAARIADRAAPAAIPAQ